MLTFNRFVVGATVGMLGLFASQWASAQTCEQEAREQALLVDDVDAGDIASYVEGCEAERLAREEDRTAEYAAMVDVDSYNVALRDVSAAPSFCALVVVEPDVTHGWRAVCVLDTGDAAPSPVPFRMAGAL